ncbi:non-specific serine,threonine protein kinase [Sarracenia purpurea var. burkii]
MDRKMLHSEDLSLWKQAVKRIEVLIHMMGSHLSIYVPKLMVLLMEDVTSFVTGEVGLDMDVELLKIAGCEGSLDESVSAFASHSRKCKQPLDVLPCGIKSTADSSEMDGRGQRLWDLFSSYIKEVIAPCLTSRFQLPNVADSTSVGHIHD